MDAITQRLHALQLRLTRLYDARRSAGGEEDDEDDQHMRAIIAALIDAGATHAERSTTWRVNLLAALAQHETGQDTADAHGLFWSSHELACEGIGGLRERQYTLPETDKVFASQWVSDTDVLLGTKCNKLLLLKVTTGRVLQIPLISVEETAGASVAPGDENEATPCPPALQGGIHAIAINPSRTLVATGGDNASCVGVYAFPSFDPVALLVAHTDWVFSLVWTDDHHLCSASRDRSLACWDIGPVLEQWLALRPSRPILINKPTVLTQAGLGKPRDLERDWTRPSVLYELSTEGVVRERDSARLTAIQTIPIRQRETVCCAVDASRTMPFLAVGSQTHVVLVDPRHGSVVHAARSVDDGWGVRSVSFHPTGSFLCIGGGMGRISFYDLRQQQYLLVNEDGYLSTGLGWLRRDTTYAQHAQHHAVCHAVYTLSFDSPGSRLFAAGGPLQLGLCGSYAGVWS